MKIRLTSLLCLLLLCLQPLALADHDALDAALDDIFPRYHTTGAVVVIGKGEDIIYHYDYGFADKKEQKPVTAQTCFKTASVSKLISAIRVMQLVEEGMLNLDTPIGNYLGYDVAHPRDPHTAVTLRMLMSHTSAIDGSYTSGRHLQSLLNQNHWETWQPGTRYRYSNLGAGIMGSLMETVTHQDVNACVDEGVFQPLGIDAAYRVWLLDTPSDASLRLDADGKLARSRTFYPAEPYDASPLPETHYDLTIGDVWIRGDDLCRLGMMLCQGGTLEGATILQPSTVEEMLSSQQGKGGITADSPYGLCVHRVDSLLDDRMIYGHQGQSGGIVCNLYWDRESGFVFAMITNGCSSKMDNYICKLSRRVFEAAWTHLGE